MLTPAGKLEAFNNLRDLMGGDTGTLNILKEPYPKADAKIQKVENGYILELGYARYVYPTLVKLSAALEKHYEGK